MNVRCGGGSIKTIFPVNDTYLTVREMEVLRLLADGYSNKEMAASLCVSIKTIEKHRQQIYHKLRVNTSIAAARVALRAGLFFWCDWLARRHGENVSRVDSASGLQIKPPSPVSIGAE